MNVRRTDTAVGDLDVDVGLDVWVSMLETKLQRAQLAYLFPGLWSELFPDHVALGTVWIQTLPPSELVIGRHDDCDVFEV